MNKWNREREEDERNKGKVEGGVRKGQVVLRRRERDWGGVKGSKGDGVRDGRGQ